MFCMQNVSQTQKAVHEKEQPFRTLSVTGQPRLSSVSRVKSMTSLPSLIKVESSSGGTSLDKLNAV